MSPEHTEPDQTPQQPDPEHGKSPTKMGFFMVPVELVGTVLLLGIGVRFLTVTGQPDAVAYVAFALAAVLVVDVIRRLRRLSTGRDRY
ncbi:MAG: hypothetical protein ACTHWM_07735 [Yaniella sp.]|uniref:hypothetical protein n=1 Tax=Yaniella sp. TaxID=2773929 RepID=UPI003F994886